MASARDAIDEAETTPKKKRISDCLDDSDGADEEAAAASPPSPGTTRLRLPRFTCSRLRFVRLGRKGGGGRKEVAAEKSKAASVDSSGWKAGGSGSSASTEAGMGLCLLFLLAKACVELNKMAEVRAQMEVLLKEMRDQAGMKSTDHVVVPRTCNLQPPSTASSIRASNTDTNGHATSSSAMEVASSGSGKPSEDEGSATMDVLEEEEFEIEPGQFRLNCNTEQETSESSDDEFIELEGGFGAAGNLRRDLEDGDDEHGAQYDDGVSALELERRLHELLHDRDRERIEELESALRRAEKKLLEKEMEARLWKDTAKLALQPLDGQ